MKTKNLFRTTILASAILTSMMAIAQAETETLAAKSTTENTIQTVQSSNQEAPADITKNLIGTDLLTIDEQNASFRFNSKLPAFTYAAQLVVQDFTGRTLKTFNVDPHQAVANAFYFNDLLSGTYSYTLLLDNEKICSGQFTLAD